ncbi:unnamed protein product, partial [Rotaria sp. Silwood1]
MPFTWTAIRLHDIFQEIVHETIISNHCNTSFANTELINSSVKASKQKSHESCVFCNTYGNFHRSRDESSTRNISRRNEDRQISTSL